MAAAEYDISIEQGATWSKTITWKDPSGTPIDLTGYVARMQFRRSVKSADVLLACTTENGRIVLGNTAGTIVITISAATTAALTFQSAVYDLEAEAPSGQVTRLMQGSVSLSREVTR